VCILISKDNNKVQAVVSKEIAAKIAEMAKEEKRSLSAMTAILIERGIESYKK
jgi:hypothetical protein